MNNEQYLLGKLAEEAAELAQIAIKAQQFGMDMAFGGQGDRPLTNRQRIMDEYNDVLGVVSMLNYECEAEIYKDITRQTAKMNKTDFWRSRSGELGFVELDDED